MRNEHENADFTELSWSLFQALFLLGILVCEDEYLFSPLCTNWDNQELKKYWEQVFIGCLSLKALIPVQPED